MTTSLRRSSGGLLLVGIHLLSVACGSSEPTTRRAAAPLVSTTPHASVSFEVTPTTLRAPRPPPEAGLWFVEGSTELNHVNLSGPTAEQGKSYLLDCIGQGVCAADIDNDGQLDLYFPQGRGDGDSQNILYRNLGDRVFEATENARGANDDSYSFGALAFDFDNDGDLDLLSTNFGKNRLYRNKGGTFTDISTDHPDLAGKPEDWSTGAAAADVDKDGDLDVYIANYYLHDGPALDQKGACRFMGCSVPCGPRGLKAQADSFLRNTGAPDWALVGDADGAGLKGVRNAYAFQPVFTDVDNDGDPDLYVANDSVQNYLFLNDGNGHFSEEAVLAGVGHGDAGNPEAGMGVSVADVDGDRLPEIHVTNFSTQSNSFYRNLSGDDLVWFSEDAHQVNLGYATFFLLSWGCTMADFDCDGYIDVFSANGHVFPQVDDCPPEHIIYKQANSLFAGIPGDEIRFEDLGSKAGQPFEKPAGHRGSAAADFDNDGALDLVVVRLDEKPLMAWNDSRSRGHWLMLTIETPGASTDSWRTDIGARAIIATADRTWTREVIAGSSFLSTEDPRIHFGLGPAEKAETLIVRFSNGNEQRWENVVANSHLRVRQGSDHLQKVSMR